MVCDRFYDSTMAYQGYGQGADRGTIATLIGLLGIVPDVTLVLDVSEPVAVAAADRSAAWTRIVTSGWTRCSMRACGRGFATSPPPRRSAAC